MYGNQEARNDGKWERGSIYEPQIKMSPCAQSLNKTNKWESGKLFLQRDIFLLCKAVSERDVPWFEKHLLKNICVAF